MEKPRDFDPELPTLVLGGGGAFGIAYEYGIYESLREHGLELKDSQMLGTSAGSWVASLIATGRGYDDVADMPQIQVPNYKKGYMQGFAREVFGDDRAANVSAMALRLPSRRGLLPRAEMLNGGEHDLADVVSASSAVPGLFRPVGINGYDYVDGGVRSVVSADLAPKSRKVLAIAALTQYFMPPVGPALELALRGELWRWKKKNDGEVVFIRPNHAVSELITSPMDCFDFAIAKEVYVRAREQGERLVNERESIASLAIRTARQSA